MRGQERGLLQCVRAGVKVNIPHEGSGDRYPLWKAILDRK